MSILTRIKRALSSYTNHTTGENLPKDIEGKQLLSEDERDARILELLNHPKPTSETIEELAKLIGQTSERKF
jgi:hypothetical protein